MKSEDIWKRDEIDSPCVNICVMDKVAGICIGCNRTRQEIADWSSMTQEQRVNIILVLPERAGLLQKGRRGGRKARLKQRES